MIRVAALLRQSTRKQAQRKGDTEPDVPAQRAAISRFLSTRQDWRLIEDLVYVEVISSFKKRWFERPTIVKLLDDARARKFDVLLLFKEDRLSRQGAEQIRLLEDLQLAGVQAWSVVDNKHLSLEEAQLILRAAEGYTANQESRKTSQRVRERMNQLAAAGRWTGGRSPFAYSLQLELDEQGQPLIKGGRILRRLVPNEWADTVRELFNRYVQGTSAQRLANWLTSIGAPTYSAETWNRMAVVKILKNPFYAGFVKYNENPSPSTTVPSPYILAKGQHAPIVDEETWKAAQEMRETRRTIPVRYDDRVYPFSGLLRCANCGSRLLGAYRSVQIKDRGKVSYPIYRCATTSTGNSCGFGTIKAEVAEERFIATLEDQLTAPSGLRSFLEQRSRVAKETVKAQQAARRRIQDRVKEIEGALKRLDVGYLEKGTISDSEYVEKKRTYQDERQALEVELAKPLATQEARDVGPLVDLAKQLRENWFAATPEERKSIALSIVKSWNLKVLVHLDKRVEILPE